MARSPSNAVNLTSITTTYQALWSDDVIVNTSTNTFVVTLPKIVAAAGTNAWTVPPLPGAQCITVINNGGSGTVTAAAASGDSIATPGALTSLTTGLWATYVSDGVSKWFTLS